MRTFKILILNLICIFLVFSTGTTLTAQVNADSLESVLKTVNTPEKLTILNTLSSYYLVKSPGKSIEFGTQAISIAAELKNVPGKIDAIVNIGDAYLSLGDNKLSLTYYEKALGIAKSASLQKEIAMVSIKIGNYYNINSVYDKALQYDLDALKIYKTIDNKPGLSDTYHNIGIVYFYLGNLDKSLDFTQKALQIREELNDKLGISKSLNNVAMIYRNMNKNDKALEYYFKALKLMEELKSVNDQSFAMTNIGITYKQMGNYDNALNYFLKSLAMYEQFTDNRNKSKLFVCLGTTYTDLKKYDKAESYLEQGLSLAKKSGYLDMIALNYKYLADLYLMMGDFKKTLDYKDLYFDIKDSVFTDANKKKIAEFQVRIETDNTQREAELIKEKSNLLFLFLISLAVAVIIITVVLYSRYRAKQNANLALNKLNFNNNEANISIEKLIFWSNYQNGNYKFTPKDIHLSEEINNNIMISKPFIESKKIYINSSISQDTIVYADSIALNLIIRYLILNAVKYSSEGEPVTISAPPKGEFIEVSFTFSTISIKLEEISKLFASNIQQIVSNKDKEPGGNLGLALCKEFVEKSGGKIWFESLADNRVSFIVTLPKKS
jgi:tetratricopeptide (TPR) repeat protein